ncbi:glycosyltransferase family 4 protein [Pseudomonas sp. PB106]|uniref:MraY family glycosyltransferase n=1 Tax=Pseudomonas sp. PB106 TaxID=2494699 RepID=UPI00131DD8F1|nr:glycosyltransferase family 4 protein [Pseudomonas sp. PB106]KAE9643768.1 glycosyltransferase family 4 protein [Pseudomonas sp. PB106]
MIAGGLLLSIFLLSWALTWGVRHYALSKSLMDIPNERSSHSVPTPRGGGVAIVVGFLLALPVLGWLGLIDRPALFALSGSGLLVALIGFADDHGHIAARWRLLGHFAAAIWALFWLDGLTPIALLNGTLDLGWVGHALAAVYLVWMLNLYNFMDGIDGLASAEALCACLGSALIYGLVGQVEPVWGVLALSAAVAGFLCWNYPPARIFMGDAGSGFLGIALGILSLEAATRSPQLLWSWTILLGAFVVDATWTLCRRLLNGDKVYQAHRSHAYQYASRQFKSHKGVTLAVVGLNVFWLLPWAVVVALGIVPGVVGLIVAYVPLLWLAARFKAGTREVPSIS